MIKRKVNTCNRKSSEDDDFYDYSERESRTRPKKNIEEIYSSLSATLEDLNRRQEHLENKINTMDQGNETLSRENNHMTCELKERSSYIDNLEALILMIVEQAALKESKKHYDNKTFFSNEAVSLSLLAASVDHQSKAQYVKSLYKEISEYNSEIKTLKIQQSNFDEMETADPQDFSEKNYSEKKNDFNETNVSSPTSLVSSDCSIYFPKIKERCTYKQPFLSNKRKRTEDEMESNSYNCKLQDSYFEEMTRLSPCLISSPTLSPQNKLNNNSIFF